MHCWHCKIFYVQLSYLVLLCSYFWTNNAIVSGCTYSTVHGKDNNNSFHLATHSFWKIDKLICDFWWLSADHSNAFTGSGYRLTLVCVHIYCIDCTLMEKLYNYILFARWSLLMGRLICHKHDIYTFVHETSIIIQVKNSYIRNFVLFSQSPMYQCPNSFFPYL